MLFCTLVFFFFEAGGHLDAYFKDTQSTPSLSHVNVKYPNTLLRCVPAALITHGKAESSFLSRTCSYPLWWSEAYRAAYRSISLLWSMVIVVWFWQRFFFSCSVHPCVSKMQLACSWPLKNSICQLKSDVLNPCISNRCYVYVKRKRLCTDTFTSFMIFVF